MITEIWCSRMRANGPKPMVSPLSLQDFEHLMAPFGTPPTRMAIALSGGGDSLCLAFLAHTWAKKHQITLMTLTVDHGLRPESAAEAHQVHAWMDAQGIPHTTLIWKGVKPVTRIQELSRQRRYELMVNWCRDHGYPVLMTAHHQGDQRETVLMRALRDSGVEGLAGMQPVTPWEGISLWRPFLSLPKERLIATLQSLDHPWIEDPSNRALTYERVRLRTQLPHLPVAHLDRLQSLMNRWRAVNSQRVAHWIDTHVTLHPAGWVEIIPHEDLFTALGEPFWKHLLRQVGHPPYGPKVEALRQFMTALMGLKNGQKATLAGCLALKHKGHIFLVADGATPEELRFDAPWRTTWENRFFFDNAAILPWGFFNFSVKRLGLSDWRQACATFPAYKKTSVPFSLIQTLPCLYIDGELAVIPFIPGPQEEKRIIYESCWRFGMIKP